MFVGRVGSLNALEQLKKNFCLREFVGGALPSADTIGRVVAKINPETIRLANREIYTRLKRNKSLSTPEHGLVPLNVDGHESHATYQRHCDGCLERRINKGTVYETTQYYHRHVTAQLCFRNFSMLLDAEDQLPGEDEVACAIRLLRRIVLHYPRAFDVVVADALYAKSNFFNFVIAQGKDVIAVLKDDRRDLVKDAVDYFGGMEATMSYEKNGTKIECWDADNFQSWPQVNKAVRVVTTKETKKAIRRQLTSEMEPQAMSTWSWVTTLSTMRAPTKTVVALGHGRWKIENNGFNESVNHYFSDHVYKHDSGAMLNFWLLCMMAYNIFHCFYLRNLKPDRRDRFSMVHVAREVQSELYRPNDYHPP